MSSPLLENYFLRIKFGKMNAQAKNIGSINVFDISLPYHLLEKKIHNLYFY